MNNFFLSYMGENTLKTDKKTAMYFLYSVIAIQFFLILLFIITQNFLITSFSLIIIPLILYFFSSRINLIVFLYIYISILPIYAWGSRYDFFRGLYFNENIALALLCTLCLYTFISSLFNPTPKIKNDFFDNSIIFFLAICFISGLNGLMQTGDLSAIKTELFFLFCYGTYFIYTKFLSISDIKILWITFICLSSLVSIEYILLAASEGSLISILLGRVVTQQPHMAQLAIPLLFSIIIISKKLIIRILAFFGAILNISMVFLSQQRGLWGALTVSLIIFFGFIYIGQKISLKNILKYFFILLIGLCLLIALLFICDFLFSGSIIMTFLDRINFLLAVSSDESLLIRVSEIQRALQQWNNNIITILFGTGLGASFGSTDIYRTYTYSVDNSFAYLLWKTGIIGLTAFIALISTFFYHGLRKFYIINEHSTRVFIGAIICGMLGIIIIALTNTCLVSYRFIIFWALGFATIKILPVRENDELH